MKLLRPFFFFFFFFTIIILFSSPWSSEGFLLLSEICSSSHGTTTQSRNPDIQAAGIEIPSGVCIGWQLIKRPQRLFIYLSQTSEDMEALLSAGDPRTTRYRHLICAAE